MRAKLDKLKGMFPHVDRQSLLNLLAAEEGNFTGAVRVSICDPSYSTTKA